MMALAKILVVSTLLAVALSAFIEPKAGPVPNSYLVVLKSNVTQTSRYVHASKLMDKFQATVTRHFAVGKFHGYSVNIPASVSAQGFVAALESDPAVKYVEQNQIAVLQQSCTTQTLPNPTGLWGLDRVSKRANNKNGRYTYDSNGAGVDIYILDTGIHTEHTEFPGGRAIWGATFTYDGDADWNGHGTHCAGTAGGLNYGVAKGSTLIAVKVLDFLGSGTYDGIISGIAWVVDRYNAVGRPSVASMSLGGPASAALDDAVDAAIEAGVTFVVAAGNDNNDACRTSPARVAAAITVGATETTDTRSTFSSWGSCVDIFAPGTNILSAWIGSVTATRTISGTSMATPHVTGAVARYLSENPSATPAQVTQAILDQSTANVLNLRCTATGCQRSPNKLLYSSCAGGN